MRFFKSMGEKRGVIRSVQAFAVVLLILGTGGTARADTSAPALVVATSTPTISLSDCAAFKTVLGTHSLYGVVFGENTQSLTDVIAYNNPQWDVNDICAAWDTDFGAGWKGDLSSPSIGIPLNGRYGVPVPDGTYYWTFVTSDSYPTWNYSGYYIEIRVSGGLAVVGADTSTRITLVTPYDGEGLPVGSVYLSASGYVNPSVADLTNVDDTSGIQVRWNVYSATAATTNCLDAICAFGTNNTGTNYWSGTGYSVFGSQTFNVSTSTGLLPADYYTLTTSIVKPTSYFGLTGLFGLDFGYQTLVSTTTEFVVGSTTPEQTAIYNLNHALTLHNPSTLVSTTTAGTMDSCNLISLTFNMGDCLFVLLYPNLSDFSPVFNALQTGLLTREPFGYATRMVAILDNTASSTASTTLPTFVITLPPTLPDVGTLTFNMQDTMDSGAAFLNSITDPITGLTLQQIVEPWIKLFIALTAFIIIFHDIMGMGDDAIRRGSGRGRSSSGGGDDSEKYRERLYNMRQ